MASVKQNGDIVQLTIPIKNIAAFPDTNVAVQFTIPSGMVIHNYNLLSNGGVFNTLTALWSIGDLGALEETQMILRLKVTDITQGPFTVQYTLTSTNDPSSSSVAQIIDIDACPPAAGANADEFGCLCIDVSLNDTVCSHGITEWRLNALSLTNTEAPYVWDELTGKGSFVPTDNSVPITGTYDLVCIEGINEYTIQQSVPFTISKQIKDKTPYNHTFAQEKYADLSLGDRSIVQDLNPSLDISLYCWNILRNGDGDITSAQPLNCDATQATSVTYQNINVDYDAGDPLLGVTLPSDPEEGDMHLVTYTNGTVYFVWDGSVWNRTFHSKNIYPVSMTVTGTSTKTITITMSNATTITANFTDLDTAVTGELVTRVNLSGNISLLNSDTKYQNILVGTAGYVVSLPGSPSVNKSFVIKNSDSSSASFTVNGDLLNPGEIWSGIYDGVEWVIL